MDKDISTGCFQRNGKAKGETFVFQRLEKLGFIAQTRSTSKIC
jgi:hypothetical protein